MKVYLVGGAVRDKYLAYPSTERDWVVVGATPNDLIKQGYKLVGRDFPVFLHPFTQEEYALARTERKSKPGYRGFDLNYSKEVSLFDDLSRRDLTINAMAIDEAGNLIDPYGGLHDLNAKIFRHVSPAFVEDPVRILRLARFTARYHHLGFTIAPETHALMYAMVKQGELHHLVAERVWQEWYKSLGEKNPEQFIIVLRSCAALRVILPELDALFGVPADVRHHPEIDCGVHSLQVLSMAVCMTDDTAVRFAALLHDLGKARTPIAQWPKHALHAELGLSVINDLCARLRIPTEYHQLTYLVSQLHSQIHRLYQLSAKEILTVLEKADAFRREKRFEQILLVCEADARAIVGSQSYTQAMHWRALRDDCSEIDVQPWIKQGVTGSAIKSELQQARLKRIEIIKSNWTIHEK